MFEVAFRIALAHHVQVHNVSPVSSFVASSHVGLDDFVEMTKKYAQGIAPSPVMAAAGGDDDDDNDDDVVVKNPDELPLHQKVGSSQPW